MMQAAAWDVCTRSPTPTPSGKDFYDVTVLMLAVCLRRRGARDRGRGKPVKANGAGWKAA